MPFSIFKKFGHNVFGCFSPLKKANIVPIVIYDVSFDFHRYFGQESLKTAMTYHLVARTHSCRGDFRSALQSEKEAFSIYKSKVGQLTLFTLDLHVYSEILRSGR